MKMSGSSNHRAGEMIPMRLSTRMSSDDTDMKPVVAHISSNRKSNGVIVIIVSLVFIAFFVLTVSSKNNPSSHNIQSNINSRPPNIRYLIHSATIRGQQSQRLVPIKKSPTEIVADGGMEFMMSYMMEPSLKSRTSGSTDFDPFDSNHLDPYLFVSMIPPLHALVLNKYTSIADHAILITNKFEPQNTPLSFDDIETWYWCVQNLQAVGFYNSDPKAGSSQKHKHMQVIPRDNIYELYPSGWRESEQSILPVEKLIFPRIQSGEWSYFNPVAHEDSIFTLSQFSFRHGVLVLMDRTDWTMAAANRYSFNEYLFTAYSLLLEAMGGSPKAGSPPSLSYNLLLTERWMMIVPRQQEEFGGLVSINGLGYMGFLLAKNASALDAIKTVGPLSALRAVSMPTGQV